jgi:hypothetical protein
LLSIPGAFLIPRNGSPDLADIKLAEQDVFFVLASTKMPSQTPFSLAEPVRERLAPKK